MGNSQDSNEPVAWCSSVEFSDALKYAQSFNGWPRKYPKTDMPLYTAPPQLKPLTEEEISSLWDGHVVPVFGKNGINPIVFARAIERAHGIT